MLREDLFYKTAMSVQALPKDAQEVQPKSSSPAESQTPNHWEEQSTSATAAADDEPSHTEVQVRMLMAHHLLLKHCHASTFLALHAIRPSAGHQVLHTCQPSHAHLAKDDSSSSRATRNC